MTLDLHANLSRRMVDACDAMVAYRTNPHLDQRERGLEAAALMAKTLRGEVHPTQAASFPPLAINIECQLSSELPCLRLYELAARERARQGVLSTSVLLGFPYADVEDTGSSTLAVTDGDSLLAQEVADELALAMWAQRKDFAGRFVDIQEALERAAGLPGPVCLLDMGDNVGGGAPGDGTFIAHALVKRRLGPAFVCLFDPEAVRLAATTGRGGRVRLRVGGKTDTLHGEPLEETFTVLGMFDGRFGESQARHGGSQCLDQGDTAVVRTEFGLTVMLTSRRMPPFSLRQLTSCGVDPRTFKVIVAKGVHAPVAAYARLSPPDSRQHPRRHLRRPEPLRVPAPAPTNVPVRAAYGMDRPRTRSDVSCRRRRSGDPQGRRHVRGSEDVSLTCSRSSRENAGGPAPARDEALPVPRKVMSERYSSYHESHEETRPLSDFLGGAEESHPERIGSFKILDVLGQGGMGVVYVAEQREPIRRRVALKLIKLGMDTREVVARFEIERQALALMSHPTIARVYEAGATESGRPYFVMELVQGVPITEYADRHRLGLRARLELFLNVCNGVQHAHHKGIIHRVRYAELLGSSPDPSRQPARQPEELVTQPELEPLVRRERLALDGFDGKPDLNWLPRYSDPAHVSWERRPGALTIVAQQGGIYESNTSVKNLYLLQNPVPRGGDFEVTTCLIAFKPTAPYQQAGLLCFDDEDNYSKWVYLMTPGGPHCEFLRETGGRVSREMFEVEPQGERVWLRLTKRGNRYRCSTSMDGRSFRTRGVLAWGDGAPKHVGLVAKSGPDSGAPEIDACFDFFELWTVEPPP